MWNIELYVAEETVIAEGTKIEKPVGVTLGKVLQAIVILVAGWWLARHLVRPGIDHLLDSGSADLEAEVARLTSGRGVDVVLDARGGEQLGQSYRMLAPLGRLVVYGSQALVSGRERDEARVQSFLQQRSLFDPMDLMNSNKGVFGLNLAHLWGERRFAAASMEALLTDSAGGRPKAVVSKAFPLAHAADAHAFLQDRANVGKVVLTV